MAQRRCAVNVEQPDEREKPGFGGYPRSANLSNIRIARRFAWNQKGRRWVVFVLRERGGNSVPAVFDLETAASFIRAWFAQGGVTPTKQRLGIISMSVSKSRASSIKRHTASMAHVLTWLRNTSFPATGAPGFGSIALSPVRSSTAARKRIQGARIAASRTAIR